MSECLKCRAREINGTLRGYDGTVDHYEKIIDKLTEALENAIETTNCTFDGCRYNPDGGMYFCEGHYPIRQTLKEVREMKR